MMENKEIRIDGCSIFFEKLEQVKKSVSTRDAATVKDTVLEWSEDMIKQAAQPLVKALGVLYQATESMAPDELELSMQLALTLNGETPVFKVLSMGADCQIAAKFVWKK